MHATRPTSSISTTLYRTCSTIALKVHDLIVIAGLRADDETASQIAELLRGLEEAITQLLRRLIGGANASGGPLLSPRPSDFCVDALRVALSASEDVATGVGNYVRPCIADLPVAHSVWDEQLVRDCTRMIATQTRMFDLFTEVLDLSDVESQVMRLESNDSLRLRHQVLQDAQTARDSSSSAAARARTQSLPSRPAALYDGIEVVPDTDAVRTRSNQTAPPTAGRFATGGRATPADNASIRSKKSFAPSQRPRLSKFLGGVGLGGVRGTACDPKYLVEQLCQACKDGDLEWARTEVDKGADVNGLDSKCSPPLYYAVLGGELSIAKLLVEHGALVGGSDGQSSAMVLYAVRRSDIPMLSYLLEHSAPVSGTCLMDKNRRVTPLELAVENGSVEAVKLLLDYGADVHGGGGDTRRRELNPLCSAVDRRHPEVVKVLLNYQARLNGTESTAKWASQVAAIHVAAYRGFEDILDILLQAGADTSVTCQRDGATGVTALHLATSSCAEMLIQAGANIRAGDSTNQYPLSGAVRVRDIGSVKALIQHGAPVNAADLRKETALEIACRLFATDARDGHPEHLATYRQIVGELLAAGKASPGSRSRGQITIRDVCKPMLRSQQPPVDGSKLDLMALMGRIIDIVESQAGVPPKPPGLLREVFGGLVENSVLALIVNKPPA